MTSSFNRLLVWVLFFLSGASGLIYEVLWCRHLGLLFGNTAHSLSTVLVAFMGGLALGSFVTGRHAERIRRPFLVYGILEVIIGLYCAVLPFFFSVDSPLTGLYRSLYGENGSTALVVVRLLVSLVLLLVPTICMGATLPLLTHYLVKSKAVLGRTAGSLYAVNSLGAALGALSAGFVLMPLLGKTGANTVAVVLNLVLGVIAIVLGRNATTTAEAESASPALASQPAETLVEQAPVSPQALRAAIICFGATGFAAMATQIGWTKAISLGTGSSTYAFSLIVSVFILGLSSGGAWASRIAARVRDPLALLARILLLTACFNMAIAVLLGYSPILFFLGLALGTPHGWNAVLASQALCIGLIIFIPTFLMGASMPLTLQVAARGTAGAARTTGNVYSVNTLGSILGSALGGLLLIPFLAVQFTLELMAGFYLVAGLILFFLSESRVNKADVVRNCALAGIAVVVALVGGRWDAGLMSSGLYLMRNEALISRIRDGDWAAAIPNLSDREILYHREGAEATVTVMKTKNELTLKVGGKPEGSTTGDATTQTTLTLLPELLHAKGAEDVLLIGLGTAVSAGSALAPASVKRVDIVEMSPEVVNGSAWFESINRLNYSGTGEQRWIDTPRVETIINDGRNHMLLSSRKYDVIASEPSNPWMAGVGNLFTREAFELGKSRLKPGGVMCQWIHTYSLDQQWVYCVIRTFCDVFPHVQLWQVQDNDLLLMGTLDPLVISAAELKSRVDQPGVSLWLKDIHSQSVPNLMSMFLADDHPLRVTSSKAPLHTDDNMLLEFNAPRSLQLYHEPFNPTVFAPAIDNVIDVGTLPANEQPLLMRELDRVTAARLHERVAKWKRDYPRHLGIAGELAPSLRPVIAWEKFAAENKIADVQIVSTLSNLEILREAVKSAEANSAANSTGVDSARLAYARALIENGDPKAGLETLEPMKSLLGQRSLVRARAYLALNDIPSAQASVKEAESLGVSAQELALAAARIHYQSKDPHAAKKIIQSVLTANVAATPETGELALLYGRISFEEGEREMALRFAGLAERVPETVGEALRLKALISYNAGDLPSYAELMRQRAYASPGNEKAGVDYAYASLELGVSLLKNGNKALARSAFIQARVFATELTVLFPKSALGWEVLARAALLQQQTEARPTAAMDARARDAVKKQLECLGGDVQKLPADLKPLAVVPVPAAK